MKAVASFTAEPAVMWTWHSIRFQLAHVHVACYARVFYEKRACKKHETEIKQELRNI